MNGVNDKLITEGCPHCAVKHLAAALYHQARIVGCDASFPDPALVHICIAAINLAEVRSGYLSHFWYAVGALVRAEELMAGVIGDNVARDIRLVLESGGPNTAIDGLRMIERQTAPSHADWMKAHWLEAWRELPEEQDSLSIDDIAGSIEYLWKKYLEAPVASPEDVGKGGESDMATKKAPPAFLAKGKDAKGAKAACKGGKAKKACGKGGKCK